MTTTDTMRELAPVITYRNLAGALVFVRDVGERPTHPNMSEYHYNATCDGCASACRVARPYVDLREAREWAGKHAGDCRALPRDTAGDAERQEYARLAAQYAGRAAGLLKSETEPLASGRRSESEKQDPTGTARVYVSIADVYARLASR